MAQDSELRAVLLELDPEDERALEGVRLCEVLADESPGGEPPPAADTGSVPAPLRLSDFEPEKATEDDPGPEDALDFDLPDLDLPEPVAPAEATAGAGDDLGFDRGWAVD